MTRIRLEYVHRYRDRHGKLRHYFRRPGFKQIALPGLPGSTEFAAYEQALAGLPRNEIGASRTRPGTVNAAIVGYYTSLAFREFAPTTQYRRRAILERFRVEHGDNRIATLPQEFIKRMLNRMKPGAARSWLKTLLGLADFTVDERFRSDNPARGFKLPPENQSSPAVDGSGDRAIREDASGRFESAAGFRPWAIHDSAPR